MTPDEIKARMKDMGITQGDLCRKWKSPKVTISFLVNRKMKSARLERRLARLLGVSVEQLINGQTDGGAHVE